MSLYNMLFGCNPLTPILLYILDIDQPDGKWKSGRFRDIYLNEDGTKIILFTRNGGGNRSCWRMESGELSVPCYEIETKPENLCPGCIITYHLPKHPNYICDYDDEFDSTYAYIEFSVPEKWKELCKQLATGEKPKTVSGKFMDIVREIEGKSPEELKEDERFKPLIEVLNKFLKEVK